MKRVLAALSFGGLVIASSSASAFLCTRTPSLGPSVAWNVRDVVVHRSGAGAENDAAAIDDAVQAGLDQWSGLACSDLQLTLGAPTTSKLVGFDWHAGSDDPRNENIIVFRNDTPGDPLDAWLHTFGALAITTVTFESTTGRLVDADIEMNDVSFEFSACDPLAVDCQVEFDLQNTLTHELGHVIGLDHPLISDDGASEATMFASASRGDIGKRDIAADDEAGLCTIYPAGEPAGECFGVGRPDPPAVRFEQTLCASGGSSTDAPSSGALVLGALLVATCRTRGRKRDEAELDHIT
ncbi:MAG: hypothetical protein Q8O67_20495 [Deltaproteobacteria bacterium]|nr:hypothetical protein [Deltaproteobacteria bacterium]